MSFVTNQRTHRPEPRPAPGWNGGVSEKNIVSSSPVYKPMSRAPFSPEVIFRLMLKQIYFKPPLFSAIVQRVNAADSSKEQKVSTQPPGNYHLTNLIAHEGMALCLSTLILYTFRRLPTILSAIFKPFA